MKAIASILLVVYLYAFMHFDIKVISLALVSAALTTVVLYPVKGRADKYFQTENSKLYRKPVIITMAISAFTAAVVHLFVDSWGRNPVETFALSMLCGSVIGFILCPSQSDAKPGDIHVGYGEKMAFLSGTVAAGLLGVLFHYFR